MSGVKISIQSFSSRSTFYYQYRGNISLQENLEVKCFLGITCTHTHAVTHTRIYKYNTIVFKYTRNIAVYTLLLIKYD